MEKGFEKCGEKSIETIVRVIHSQRNIRTTKAKRSCYSIIKRGREFKAKRERKYNV